MKTETTRFYLGLAAAALMLLSGCDIRAIGQKGVLEFHPDDCGGYTLGCDFKKPLAVGGTLEFRLKGPMVESGLMVESDEPSKVSVVPSESGDPVQFKIQALGSGDATLTVIDDRGDFVDSILVKTIDVDALRLRPFTNLPDEPETDVEGYQTYRVPAEKMVSFWAGPDVGDDWKGMGKFAYEILDVSQDLAAAMDAEESNNIEEGFFAFRMPEGSHQFVLGTADGAHVLDVLFIAE